MIERERERERGRDIGRGRSRLHAPGARREIRSRVSRITPQAEGRRQTAAPPRDPSLKDFKSKNMLLKNIRKWVKAMKRRLENITQISKYMKIKIPFKMFKTAN